MDTFELQELANNVVELKDNLVKADEREDEAQEALETARRVVSELKWDLRDARTKLDEALGSDTQPSATQPLPAERRLCEPAETGADLR